MKGRTTFAAMAAAITLGGTVLMPLTASAQNRLDKASQHRQQTKNQWRNIAIGGGVATLFGLLTHDNTVTFAGAAGGLYSLSRYEADRKSQSKIDHARADMFGRSSFDRNGHHYVRKTVTKGGHKYYQFVRK